MRLIHGRTQEEDTEMTHETIAMYTCLRPIYKTIMMVHATDMATDTTLESIIQDNSVKPRGHFRRSNHQTTNFQSCGNDNDINHHNKTGNMTLILNLDDEATTVQSGPEAKHLRIAKELIIPPKNAKLVFFAWKLKIFVMSTASREQVF